MPELEQKRTLTKIERIHWIVIIWRMKYNESEIENIFSLREQTFDIIRCERMRFSKSAKSIRQNCVKTYKRRFRGDLVQNCSKKKKKIHHLKCNASGNSRKLSNFIPTAMRNKIRNWKLSTSWHFDKLPTHWKLCAARNSQLSEKSHM